MFTKPVLSVALLGASVLPLVGQSTQITQISGKYVSDFGVNIPPTNALQDENGVPLSAGTVAAGDGDILQFGYFAGVASSTDVSLFGQAEWDSFTPLTSMGGRHLTTIGDSGGVSGNVGIFTIPGLSLSPSDPEMPGSGFPLRLGIRFFNDTTLESSTHYNVVTSQASGWVLQPPNEPPPLPAALDLDALGNPFFWQSGPGGAFQTALVMTPEPSTAMFVLVGALAFAVRRRRRG